MRTALRKMGNSTGMIVPKAILRQAGVEAGTDLELTVVEGAIMAKPAARHPREGWEEDAKALAAAGDDKLVWPDFANDFDEEWTWPGLDEDEAR